MTQAKHTITNPQFDPECEYDYDLRAHEELNLSIDFTRTHRHTPGRFDPFKSYTDPPTGSEFEIHYVLYQHPKNPSIWHTAPGWLAEVVELELDSSDRLIEALDRAADEEEHSFKPRRPQYG